MPSIVLSFNSDNLIIYHYLNTEGEQELNEVSQNSITTESQPPVILPFKWCAAATHTQGFAQIRMDVSALFYNGPDFAIHTAAIQIIVSSD